MNKKNVVEVALGIIVLIIFCASIRKVLTSNANADVGVQNINKWDVNVSDRENLNRWIGRLSDAECSDVKRFLTVTANK